MIFGMTTHTYTVIHVVLSLIGIASGLVVVFGMLAKKRLDGLTALFCSENPNVEPVGVKVKFWGRLSRPDTMTGPITAEYHWNCTKTSDSYDCKAID